MKAWLAHISPRMLRWFIFGVLLGLAPLLLGALKSVSGGTGWQLQPLIARGELTIVAAGMAGAALGELMGLPHREGRSALLRSLEICCGGICFLLAALTSMWFADLAGTPAAEIDNGAVAATSVNLYISTLVASGGCVLLAGHAEVDQ